MGGSKMRKVLTVAVFLGLFMGAIFVDEIRAAEQYPVKPVEWIVAVEAGADGDQINRPVVKNLSEILGQPVIIVNKPGGGSTAGYRELLNAKPDGYTVGWGSSTLVGIKLQGIAPFDDRNFTLLGNYGSYIAVLVASTSTKRPFKTVQEFISFSKANPGEVTMATAWTGGGWWVAAQAFLTKTGLKINAIPITGSGAMGVAQTAGGHMDVCIVGLGAAKSLIEGGQLRLLATLGEERLWPPYDKVPTMKELGYDMSYESPNFAMGPANLPPAIVDRLVPAVKKAVDTPEYKKYCADRAFRWNYLPPDKMRAKLDDQRMMMRDIFSKAGVLKESK
jgi:tripartite-type tricarboxylate transporter receptor subunit TctC